MRQSVLTFFTRWVYGITFQENGESGGRGLKRENPHKYLLYKPTFSQLMVFLASGFKELPTNGAMLLYVSADGAFTSSKHPQDCKYFCLNPRFFIKNMENIW